MNIYDISKKAGVSIATVSRVLNNNPHVSPETRKRVMAVIDESRYVPNAFARGLGLNTMKTIGLLCPDASDPYQAQALDYLESDFREAGYDCLLSCTGYAHEARQLGVELMKTRHVDGMVLMGSSFMEDTDEANAYIRDAGKTMPVVMLNGSFHAEGVYCVNCDDEQASYEATLELIRSGKKRILYLHHNTNYAGRKKLNGYKRALTENGLKPDEKLIRLVNTGNHNIHQVQAMLEKLDREGLQFDAVYCSEDALGVGAIKYAKAMGRKVPEDISVIGYNNSVLCVCTEPEMTSVDNKLAVICSHIVKTMIGALEERDMPRQTVFNAELIKRGSTK